MMLADCIVVARRFQRSVRIDTDLRAASALQGFVCQGSGKTALETMARLVLESGQRAFTWTGPYGGGKSSLALALGNYVSADVALHKTARALLEDVSFLDEAFPSGPEGWLVVPVVGRRSDPIEAIRTALAAAIVAEPTRARTRRRQPEKSGADVIDRLLAEADARPSEGVLLILDEMGKFLEGAAAEGTDIHFFQELAETAGRCKGRLIVIGVLHQAFEQYGARLGAEAQTEWAKIQGRYVDIPIITAVDEVIDLLGRAIVTEVAHSESREVADRVAEVIRRRRPGSPEDLGERLDRCWPLHPVTAALLGPVSRRRFGQNERSTFGFLGSREPEGFQDFLRATPAAGGLLYDPARLWDYLRINLEPAILASPDGHRWAQGSEAVDRCLARGSELHQRLLKTIAVIDLFRNGSGLMADRPVLHACLCDVEAMAVDRALAELEEWSITIFRKHVDAWALYAGSDFNIDEAVARARAEATGLDLERLARLAGLQPILAKQHYYRTGTLRWFEAALVTPIIVRSEVQKFLSQDGSAGKFFLVLPSGKESEGQAKTACRGASKLRDDYPVVVGLPRRSFFIRELGAELIALETVRATRSELEGDAVARREIDARIAATSAQVEQELKTAFTDAAWYVAGSSRSIEDARGLSRLASELCDDIFKDAPTIRSELINRENPSSNSQAAVRQLLHAMVAHPSAQHLGIEGYPAERGLYSTVLAVAGLHGSRGNEGERFGAPDASTEVGRSFLPMWQRAESLLDNATGRLRLSTLYDSWTAPPFGIRRGLLPVLAMAFIQAHRSSVAVYCDGMFQPDVNDVVADLLLQNEALIELHKVDLAGQNERILEYLAQAVGQITGDAVEPEPLAVARALVRLVFRLPPWTRRTSEISPEAETVRRVLLNASDPYRALFVDLPLAFRSGPPENLGSRIAGALAELNQAYPQMLSRLRERMLEDLGEPVCDIGRLNDRARTIVGVTGDLRLDAFATRLLEFAGGSEAMESIAALAINKPAREWSDRDPERAAYAVAELALKFRQAETLSHVKGRSSSQHAIAVVFGAGEKGRTLMKTFDVSETERQQIDDIATKVLAELKRSGLAQQLLLAALAEAGVRALEEETPAAPQVRTEAAAS
jgi:hypothetical protein